MTINRENGVDRGEETFKTNPRNQCAGDHGHSLYFLQSELTFCYCSSQHTESVQLWGFKILENMTVRELEKRKTEVW